jgi:hypothetical protein
MGMMRSAGTIFVVIGTGRSWETGIIGTLYGAFH